MPLIINGTASIIRTATGLAERAERLPGVQRSMDASTSYAKKAAVGLINRGIGAVHMIAKNAGLKTTNTDVLTLSQDLLSRAKSAGIPEKAEGIDRLIKQNIHPEDAHRMIEEEMEARGNQYFDTIDFATLHACAAAAIPSPKSAIVLLGELMEKKIATLEPMSKLRTDETAKGLVEGLKRARNQLKLIVDVMVTPRSNQGMVKEVENELRKKDIIVNFSDNLHISGLFETALNDIHARGIKIPKEIRASESFADSTVPFDDSFDNVILINKKFNWKQASANDVYAIIGRNIDSGRFGTYTPSVDDLTYISRIAGQETGSDATGRAFKGYVFDQLVQREGNDLMLEPRTLGLYKSLGGIIPSK